MPSCAGSGISHTLMQVFYILKTICRCLLYIFILRAYENIFQFDYWYDEIIIQECILISLVFFYYYYQSIEEDEEQLHFDALLHSSMDLYLVGIRQQTLSDELQHLRTSNNFPKELLHPTVQTTPDYLIEK